MTQFYLDPERKAIPYALPNAETFYIDHQGHCDNKPFELPHDLPGDTGYSLASEGWYWWLCFPGCLPDSDPFGPFPTEAKAIANAQDSD